MAAFSPSQAQTTDTYTAVGSGVYSGAWDSAADWLTGSTPTSTSNVVFVNPYSLSNDIYTGAYGSGGYLKSSIGYTVTETGTGTETVNSIWALEPQVVYPTNPPHDDFIFANNVAVDGTQAVNGFSGFYWGVVNEDDPVDTQSGNNDGFNLLNFNNTLNGTATEGATTPTYLILDNLNTALAGGIDANIKAVNPGSTLLITSTPSLLGEAIGPGSGNREFIASGVVANSLTNISTVDVAVNGGGTYTFGNNSGGLTIGANASSTSFLLEGGALTVTGYPAPIQLGTLTLGIGTNILNGSGHATFNFSGLGGLTDSTPVDGAVLVILPGFASNGNLAGTSLEITNYENSTGPEGTNDNNVNGIIGGWAILSGSATQSYESDWATYTTTGAVTALTSSGYTYDDNINGTGISASGSGVLASAWNATENIDLGTSVSNAGTTTVTVAFSDSLGGNTTINSLRFGIATGISNSTYYMSGSTLDVAGNQLVINSGGILQAAVPSGTATVAPFTITSSVDGGSLTAGGGNNYNLYIYTGAGGPSTEPGDLTWNTKGAAASMLINAAITDNDTSGTNEPVFVTVSSAYAQNSGDSGNVYLYGNNSYSGNTYLVGPSAASIDADSGLGKDGNQVDFNGGTLYINAAISSFGHQIVVGSDGGVITIEPIGTVSSGVVVPTSGLVLTDQNGAPAITGSGPLTITSDDGTANDELLTTSAQSNTTTPDVVEFAGKSTLTGPLVLEGNNTGTQGGYALDVYLDNPDGSGTYALNSDTYLDVDHNAVNLTWEASNQVNPTAVIDITNISTNAAATMQLQGFSDTIGGLIETQLTDTTTFSGTASGTSPLSAINGVELYNTEGVLENSSVTTASTITLDTLDRIDVLDGVYVYDGSISGSGTAGSANAGVVNVVKTGPAIQELNGADTYTGTTTVNAGTLLVTGTTTNGGNYFVNGGGDPSSPTATLGGYGSIALASTSNTFTVSGTSPSNPGIIYPGSNGLAALTAGFYVTTSGTPAGTTDYISGPGPQAGQNIDLTLGSQGTASVAGISTTVNFGLNSELKLDLGSNGLNTQLYVYGNIYIATGSNTTLALNILPGSTVATGYYALAVTDDSETTGTGYSLYSGDYLGTIRGTFDNVVVTGGVLGYTLDYTSDPGEILLDVTSFSVPEPSVMAMMVGALGLLVFVIRRRKNASA